MVKVNSRSIVRITVGTLLSDLNDQPIPIMQKLVDKSVSWDSFLRNNGVTLDPELYCLTAVSGRIRALIQDKISDVTDNYKRARSEYKVLIVRRQSRYSYRNRSPQRPRIHRVQPQQTVTENTMLDDAHLRQSSRPRKPTKRYAEEEEEEEQMEEEMDPNNEGDENDSSEEPIVAPASPAAAAPRRQYVPSTRSQTYSAAYEPSDLASQASRDTFDANIGEDIKGVVMAKLRDWATNGDLYRIREELRVLQANRKSLKVARYIPYTMNVLGVLFGQG